MSWASTSWAWITAYTFFSTRIFSFLLSRNESPTQFIICWEPPHTLILSLHRVCLSNGNSCNWEANNRNVNMTSGCSSLVAKLRWYSSLTIWVHIASYPMHDLGTRLGYRSGWNTFRPCNIHPYLPMMVCNVRRLRFYYSSFSTVWLIIHSVYKVSHVPRLPLSFSSLTVR